MVSQRRLLNLLTLFIVISLFAVACERPLGGSDDATTDDQTGQTDDTNVGGGTDGDGGTTTDETTPPDTTDGGTTDSGTTDGGETETPADDGSTTTDGTDQTDDSTTTDGQTTDDTAVDETTDATTDDTAVDETTEDNADQASDTTSDGTIPATHTVAAGENLYRIGLKYGVSWVAIANANNLANPNILTVGQVLTLPGASAPNPDLGPTPSPQTETTYVVQPGDNLFRIGLKFGSSWVQIAEANGLVNPNLITVGDELKIPVDAPGPAPAFSHVVKQGETLFLISLQYGVAWPTIAEANGLTSPYVIYVGQTLEIPGS